MTFTAGPLILFSSANSKGAPLLAQQPAPHLSPEAQELLAQLRDIREPAPVSWWPPAPGWWLLALLLLGCCIAVFLWLRHRRRQHEENRYREEAVKLLCDIDTNDTKAAQEINEILKRAAVKHYGRAVCGSLTGLRWLNFLERAADIECPPQARNALLENLYRENSLDVTGNKAFRDYAINWIQQHGTPCDNSDGSTKTEVHRV